MSPLRVASLEAQAGTLERATLRALLGAGAELSVRLTASDPRSFGERAQALRDARPDVVVVPLTDRRGGDRLVLLAEPLRFGCAAQRPAPRVVLASSDDGAIARATGLLVPFPLEILPDVRTDDGRRRMVARLRELAGDAVARDLAIELLARRASVIGGGSALVIDVTGSSTSLARAEPDGPFHVAHARPLGMGAAADRVVARAGLDRVRRWIPWPIDPPTLLDRVFDRAHAPDAPSDGRETGALDLALAHEAVGHALADASAAGFGTALRSARSVVLTGRLAALSDRAAILVTADALEPIDAVRVSIDRDGTLLPLAASGLASGDHAALDAAVGALPVAAWIVPVTTARRTIVRVASSAGERLERAERGALFVVPVVGPADVSGTGVAPARIPGGPVPVVIDARPRPLELPQRDAERVPTVVRWDLALGSGGLG